LDVRVVGNPVERYHRRERMEERARMGRMKRRETVMR
jgi:hypothetical protein